MRILSLITVLRAVTSVRRLAGEWPRIEGQSGFGGHPRTLEKARGKIVDSRHG
jgi:hypothetical protein